MFGAVDNVDPLWEAALAGDAEAVLVLADAYQADGAKLDWGMRRYTEDPSPKTRDDLLGDMLIHTWGPDALKAVRRVDIAMIRQVNLLAFGSNYRAPKPKGASSKVHTGLFYPEPVGRWVVGRLLLNVMLAARNKFENLKGIYAAYVSQDLVRRLTKEVYGEAKSQGSFRNAALVAAGVGVRNEFGEIRVSEGWPIGYPTARGFQTMLPLANPDHDGITSIIALMRRGPMAASWLDPLEIHDPAHSDWAFISTGGTIPISGNSQNRPTAYGFWRYETR